MEEAFEMAVWGKAFFFIVVAIFASVVFIVFFNRNMFLSKASGYNGALLFTQTEAETTPGGIVSTDVYLDTAQATVYGAKVYVRFQSDSLELLNIIPLAQDTTVLRNYQPVDINGNFNAYEVVSRGNREGLIEFSAFVKDIEKSVPSTLFMGKVAIARLTFRSIKSGKNYVVFGQKTANESSIIGYIKGVGQNILVRTNMLSIDSKNPSVLK